VRSQWSYSGFGGASLYRDTARVMLVVGSVGAIIAIAVQGWLGGSFMHGGLDHLAF